jgi:hypothetical protein
LTGVDEGSRGTAWSGHTDDLVILMIGRQSVGFSKHIAKIIPEILNVCWYHLTGLRSLGSVKESNCPNVIAPVPFFKLIKLHLLKLFDFSIWNTFELNIQRRKM